MKKSLLQENGIDNLPMSLLEAVEEMKKDKMIKNILGKHIMDQYLKGKEAEWNEYITRVSNWEIDKYITIY